MSKEDKSSPDIFEMVKSGVKLTPMMQQYFSIKENYKDIIVLFRMGDFYEVFFDDAIKASRILNIALTYRGKIGDYKIPMAGIPHHAASTYIDRITDVGEKAAICEQIEDPKAAKGIVKRAVTLVVSPGMPYDIEKIRVKDNKFLAAGFYNEGQYTLSFIDFTTGEFFGLNVSNENEFIDQLKLYAPQEFISSFDQWKDHSDILSFINADQFLHSSIGEEYFQEKYSALYIEKLIPAYKRDKILNSNHNALSTIGGLSYYICSTQSLETVDHVRPYKLLNNENHMKATQPTLVGLEILPKTREHYKNSILGFCDRTKTSMGSRYLRQIFLAPLKDKTEIESRFDGIDYFLNNISTVEDLRSEMATIRDVDRIMAKITTKRANGADLCNLATAFDFYFNALVLLKNFPTSILAPLSKTQTTMIQKLSKNIQTTINDEIGANLNKGNLIKQGANKERDKLAHVAYNASEAILNLEKRFREETGISNLKIKSNNVAGYFIEVSKANSSKMPERFQRRQTLVNCERYISTELNELEKDIIAAKEKLQKLERKIFDDIIVEITKDNVAVTNICESIASLDVFQSLAWVAYQEEFTRPIISDKKVLNIQGAFHPLIKKNIKDQFVTHNMLLDDHCYFALITGPNMAGKTTVMREMAIIQFLTQIGSFVPAGKVEIGLCDYLFSRLGAHDDIIKGQSTFMVEMTETAEILRHATENSLIILDEIGRGTSTYDGMSIAWSLVEHFIHEIKARTLFSTHYHELIDLVDGLGMAKNLTVKTEKVKGKVQFLYELIEEGAAQSFGLNVAELAGLPKNILKRSREILDKLEENSTSNVAFDELNNKTPQTLNADQMSFFMTNPAVQTEIPEYLTKLEDELGKMDVHNMTPLQAINKLNEIKVKYLEH
jgi:DNA mismatch repair protein MutS